MPTCPSCGIEVPESSGSCVNCGHSFADRQTDDGPSVTRLPAVDVLRWCGEHLARSPALVVLALVAGAVGVVAGRFVSPEIEWVVTTTAALYPAAVAHRYVAAWAADEPGGTAEFAAALRRLPAMAGVYLAVLVVLIVALFLCLLVLRPVFGFLVWLGLLVYLLLRFALAFPAAVVAERGPGRALEESWVASDGARATIFGIVVVLVLAGLPFEAVQGRSFGLQLTAAAVSGVLSTLASASFARVFLQQTL